MSNPSLQACRTGPRLNRSPRRTRQTGHWRAADDETACRNAREIGNHRVDEAGERGLAGGDEAGERRLHGAEGALGRGPGLVEGALALSTQAAERHRKRLCRAPSAGKRGTGLVAPARGFAQGPIERADPLQRLLHVRADTERELEITGHSSFSSVAGARSARLAPRLQRAARARRPDLRPGARDAPSLSAAGRNFRRRAEEEDDLSPRQALAEIEVAASVPGADEGVEHAVEWHGLSPRAFARAAAWATTRRKKNPPFAAHIASERARPSASLRRASHAASRLLARAASSSQRA